MEKTLNYLNSKWWYRTIKVVYIFAFIFIQAFALIGIYSLNNSEWQVKKITKVSLINIGREIKKYEIGYLFDLKNPMPEINCGDISTKLGSDCAKEFFDSKEYIDYSNKRENYVNTQIGDLSSDDFYIIGKTAYENNYENFRKEAIKNNLGVNSAITDIVQLRVEWIKHDAEKYEFQSKYSLFQQMLFYLTLFIGITLVFISIQRGFYYIMFGTVNPKK